MGKGKVRGNEIMIALLILAIIIFGAFGAIFYGWGLFSWLGIIALILSIIFIKKNPRWLFIIDLVLSSIFTLCFLYLVLGSF